MNEERNIRIYNIKFKDLSKILCERLNINEEENVNIYFGITKDGDVKISVFPKEIEEEEQLCY